MENWGIGFIHCDSDEELDQIQELQYQARVSSYNKFIISDKSRLANPGYSQKSRSLQEVWSSKLLGQIEFQEDVQHSSKISNDWRINFRSKQWWEDSNDPWQINCWCNVIQESDCCILRQVTPQVQDDEDHGVH